MEDRVQQFHNDAQRPRDAKTPKEIERLRKFLFKNQEYRFTEREQSHLFGAIQSHYAAHCDLPDATAREPVLELVEDALKMPFTVFTSSQKKTLLKWHAKLTGDGEGSARAAATTKQVEYQVIDMNETSISCMTDDGDVVEVEVSSSDTSVIKQLRDKFDAGASISVTLDPGRKTVLCIRAEDAV